MNNMYRGDFMRKYKTEELILICLGFSFLLFLLLANKSEVFKICSLLSFAGIWGVKGYENIKNGSEAEKDYGRIKIIISIILILCIFNKVNNKELIPFIEIGVLVIIFLFYRVTITQQQKNIWIYMGVLFFGNALASGLIIQLIFNLLNLPKSYIDIVSLIVYFVMWIVMSLYGQIQVMKKCDLIFGVLWISILMISTLSLDILTPVLSYQNALTPEVLQQSDMGKFLLQINNEIGYTLKDILKIGIESIVYSFIFVISISYVILHFREAKI